MPPCSDVRALARTLGEGDDFVTFVDVLPLQRLARDLVHMPRPTLEAIVELHDAPHVTLGAQEVLMDMLRSYHHRASQERKLAQRLLGRAHAHKTIRLQVGQHATIALPCGREESWQVDVAPVGDSSGEATVAWERHPRRKEQQLELTARVPGHVVLVAQRATQARLRATPWPAAVPSPKRQLEQQTTLSRYELGVIIETADDTLTVD